MIARIKNADSGLQDTSPRQPVVSIVVPLFNEEEVFPSLRNRLESVLSAIEADYEVELVLVDDGSKDRTWEMIEGFAKEDGRVRGISLSRNFGHQRALFCGYQLASGEAVISMDGDLQDPPELIQEMLAKWEAGFEIVFAVRKSRFGESRFKRWTAHWFYRLMNRLADVDAPLDCGDFRLIGRKSLNALLAMGDKQKYLRGMVGWIGFPSTRVEYDRPPRAAGKTKFSLAKMFKFAFEGITSFSDAPLRAAFLLSVVAPLPFLVYLLYAVILHVLKNEQLVPGWTSLLLCIVVFGTLNLMVIGIVGDYLAKIFEVIKQRPDYIIKRRTDLPEPARPMRQLQRQPDSNERTVSSNGGSGFR
jgi:polyisoprenyl-phosphate glycosyltransferase